MLQTVVFWRLLKLNKKKSLKLSGNFLNWPCSNENKKKEMLSLKLSRLASPAAFKLEFLTRMVQTRLLKTVLKALVSKG